MDIIEKVIQRKTEIWQKQNYDMHQMSKSYKQFEKM